ncbi:MAG: tRNA (adenosine(37)-N6)-threonylcarbamoyltransferase complex ATPase subunit type 1 TsaE [Verrucomicrobia bacterium]|nr:tRNA (adenosine(37)-N6)-threonylcarbamoyltransferase complex ATPase subunit type 1 TsaE [Verrucomicrobiota bacterium]
MDTSISRSAEDTRGLGREWAVSATAGWVIALTGDLGSGKTELVKGFAAGLGVSARVHSPTYALIHEHQGTRLTLHHLDLYRLETAEAILRAGLEEYLVQPAGVSIVEWAERWFDAAPGCLQLPGRLRRVWFETIGPFERRIRYEDIGP